MPHSGIYMCKCMINNTVLLMMMNWWSTTMRWMTMAMLRTTVDPDIGDTKGHSTVLGFLLYHVD